MINRQRILKEFCELIMIDSPTKNERVIANVLKERLINIGLNVTEDSVGLLIGGNCGNVFAYLKGNLVNAPVLLFSAHMDTVAPCLGIKPIIQAGVIRSSGSTILGADDKSGIVPILEALRTIQETKIPHGDIQVIFNVAEEGGLSGSKNLDQTLLKADLGFVLDCGGMPGTIILDAPGQDRINVTITGKSAHAGVAPEEGINAIVVAAKAIARMKIGRIDDETTSNVGTIHGGLATNIVAERVDITCEARSHDLKKLGHLTEEMCDIFKRTANEMGAVAEVETIRLYNPFKIAKESQIAQLTFQAALATQLAASFGATGGGSDANYYNHYGIPCLVLATGMQKYHTMEEYIEEEDLYRTTELVVEIIKAVSRIKKH